MTVSGQILSLESDGSGVVVGGSRTVEFGTLKGSASATATNEGEDFGGSIVTDRVKNPVESASTGGLLPDVEGSAVDFRRPTLWRSAVLVLMVVGALDWV